MLAPQNDRRLCWILTATGVLGASGVLVGAFIAHGLEDWLIERGQEGVAKKRVRQADVGVRYQLIHTATLLAFAGVRQFYHPKKFITIVCLIVSGTLLFSGSLYVLVAFNLPVLGAVTPLGGMAWIAAWILIAMPCARGCPTEKPTDHTG